MEKYAGYDDQSRISSGLVYQHLRPHRKLKFDRHQLVSLALSRTPVVSGLWDLMILLLAVVGSVDAIVCKAFDALPGPQTGNTVLLGITLAHGQFPLATARSAALFGYLVGAAIGQVMIVKHRGSWPWPSAAGTIEMVELMFLGALIVAWRLTGAQPVGTAKDIFVAMLAIAMGIRRIDSRWFCPAHGG